MLTDAAPAAFVPSTDLDRSRSFYEGTLGARLVEANPARLIFDVAGTKLSVVLVGDSFDQDAAGIWTAPSGTRVAWFEDPDGNNLSLND